MSGNGGFRHRERRRQRKRTRARKLGHANIARVRKMFEEKGQTWDPTKNSVQAQALNHHGRRASGVASARPK
jgi:hypothetical protein